MKILFVHHGSVPGGAPTSLRNMIAGLRKEDDLRIKVFCIYKSMIPFFREIKGVYVKKYHKAATISGKVFIGLAKIVNIRTMIATFFELLVVPITIHKEKVILKKERPCIVHLNSSILWSTAIAAKACNIPLVWHVRETFTGGRYNFRRILYAWFLKKMADQVICISPSEEKSINGLNADNVSVIYNSIDFLKFQKEKYDTGKERERLNIPEDAFVILSLGGLSFRKGAFQLIEAMQYLDGRFYLVIAGADRPKERRIGRVKKMAFALENIIVRSGIKKYYSWLYNDRVNYALEVSGGSRVRFAGILDDIVPALNICDLLAFAGTTPHFGRPVFEAWAMKKPVVVFDTEVMRSEIENEVDGVIVRAHTGKALADAVFDLSQNPEKRKKMGEKGYKKALERFSLEKNTKKIIGIYEKVMKNRVK